MHGNSAHEVVPNLDNINLLTIFYRVCNKSMLKVFKLQMLKCVGTKKSRLRVTSTGSELLATSQLTIHPLPS